jgi:hypothetical protein
MEAGSEIAGAVVGEQAPDVDAEPREPRDRRSQEVTCTGFGLVRVHGSEGDTAVIVDGDVEELGPDAHNAVAAVAGDAVRGMLDADQALRSRCSRSPGAAYS